MKLPSSETLITQVITVKELLLYLTSGIVFDISSDGSAVVFHQGL